MLKDSSTNKKYFDEAELEQYSSLIAGIEYRRGFINAAWIGDKNRTKTQLDIMKLYVNESKEWIEKYKSLISKYEIRDNFESTISDLEAFCNACNFSDK